MEETRGWRQQGIEMKDRKRIKNRFDNDLKEIRHDNNGNGYSHEFYIRQKGGIVRVMRESFESEDEFQTVQEQHNANHALYYLSIITDAIIRGRASGNDGEKIKRTKEHMRNLYEFLVPC